MLFVYRIFIFNKNIATLKNLHLKQLEFCFLRLWNNRGFCPWRDLIPVGETMLVKACLGACTQAGFN